MSKTISISNQKGGVGKTTTACVLIGELTKRGYNVLGVDLDPQGNLSDSFKADKNLISMIDILTEKEVASDSIQVIGNYSIIPASVTLSVAEKEVRNISRETILREMLEPLENKYDYIIIDTPPTLGFLTLNAFTASDSLIIPSTPTSYSIAGIVELNKSIQQVKKYLNANLNIDGILVTRIRKNTNVGKDLLDLTNRIAETLNAHVFKSTIRDSVSVEQAILAGENLSNYNNPVMEDYKKFVDEFLEIK